MKKSRFSEEKMVKILREADRMPARPGRCRSKIIEAHFVQRATSAITAK